MITEIDPMEGPESPTNSSILYLSLQSTPRGLSIIQIQGLVNKNIQILRCLTLCERGKFFIWPAFLIKIGTSNFGGTHYAC